MYLCRVQIRNQHVKIYQRWLLIAIKMKEKKKQIKFARLWYYLFLYLIRVSILIICNYTSYEFRKHVISGNIIFLTRSFPSMTHVIINYPLNIMNSFIITFCSETRCCTGIWVCECVQTLFNGDRHDNFNWIPELLAWNT